MSLKTLTLFCFVLVIISCKHSGKTSTKDVLVEQEESHRILNKAEIDKLKYPDFGLDSNAEKLIKDWGEYIQYGQLIQNIKNANFSELKANHEVLKTLIIDAKMNIPLALNSPSILARLMVFETKLFKLESLVNISYPDKEEFINSVKELLMAFSNLNFQINKKLEYDAQKIEKPI